MSKEFEIQIKNPIIGGLILAVFFGAIGYVVFIQIDTVRRQRRDHRGTWQGKVIERGQEDDYDSPPRMYLIIETDDGKTEKRYVGYESHSRCCPGDYVVKKAGVDNIALPEGEKPAVEMIEELKRKSALQE